MAITNMIIHDFEGVPGEMRSILATDYPCLKRSAFFYFLEDEIARSVRYNNFLTLLLIKADAEQVGDESHQYEVQEFVQAIRNQLRKTDYLGHIHEATFGLILINSSTRKGSAVWNRLQLVSSAFLVRYPFLRRVPMASVVFPSDANDLESFVELATSRLAEQNGGL